MITSKDQRMSHIIKEHIMTSHDISSRLRDRRIIWKTHRASNKDNGNNSKSIKYTSVKRDHIQKLFSWSSCYNFIQILATFLIKSTCHVTFKFRASDNAKSTVVLSANCTSMILIHPTIIDCFNGHSTYRRNSYTPNVPDFNFLSRFFWK